MRVGIVYRERAREVFVKTIGRFFEVLAVKLDEDLPPIVEKCDLPESLFECDVVLSYAFHPDVNLEIAERAKGLVIIVGRDRYLRRKGVIVEDVCCATLRKHPFFERFGIPEFEVEIEDGRLKNVKVLRSAPCGATFFVAERLKGVEVNRAPILAGYYAQIYPCLSTRGRGGGIHKAGKVHELAIMRAIRKALHPI